MCKRYFRVKKDNFLWIAGAILEMNKEASGYAPLNQSTLWNASDYDVGEYISSRIIENSPEWFEEVFAISGFNRTIYKLKKEAMELINKEYSN